MKLINNLSYKDAANQNLLTFDESRSFKARPTFNTKTAIEYSSNRLINLFQKNNFVNFNNYLERVALKENEFLYKPDDQVHYLYFPESAVISEFQILEDGKTIEIGMIGREGITKPFSIFSKQPINDWTQVSVAGTALRIGVKILNIAFKENGFFQSIILDYLQKYFEQNSQRTICNSYHLLAARLCSWLLMVSDRTKRNKLMLTHEKAARLLGAYRPNISVAAKLLQTNNIISYERGHLTILDRRTLEASACECYKPI